MRKFKYVFFDAGTYNKNGVDTNDYYYTCTLDLRSQKDVEVISFPSEGKGRVFHVLFVISLLITQKIKFLEILLRPFYPHYTNRDYKKTDRLCFVIYGYYITPGYIRYIRNKFPNSKVVKIHRDAYSIWKSKNTLFTDNDIEELFDLQLSYDLGDSDTYGFIHFDEIESKRDIEYTDNYPIYDVFFAGAAKDRLPTLISFYDFLEQRGLNCFFFITNAKKEEQVERKGIHYADKGMSYREMLYYTVNSEVILEINQGTVDGFTSRFLEAVMYNKKLITNNLAVKNNRYYDSRFIKCVTNPDDIDIDFIKEPLEVDFHYQDEFSPTHLIDLIDKSLVDKFGEPMVFSK